MIKYKKIKTKLTCSRFNCNYINKNVSDSLDLVCLPGEDQAKFGVSLGQVI